ncbi:MAG: hypothetical protein ABFR19_00975 [Pseudomonadota bacterium]
MQSKEYFFRDAELGSEQRSLPAETYNAMHLLFEHSGDPAVFVPIRSMQYLAVIDAEEVIFVDAVARRRLIELSWCNFSPRSRTSLTDAVPFRFVYYDQRALETMKRLQCEFSKFVKLKSDRLRQDLASEGGDIIGFPSGDVSPRNPG